MKPIYLPYQCCRFDAEFYISSDGIIVNPEKYIKGIDATATLKTLPNNKVSLNTGQNACRALLGNDVMNVFRALKNKHGNKIEIRLNRLVNNRIGPAKLYFEAPVYGGKANPSDKTNYPYLFNKKNEDSLSKLMDILVGNFAVLLDRNRKIDIKAGTLKYIDSGIEYSSLSNFFLRSYPLFSFLFSHGRVALSISEDAEACKKIFQAVNYNDVVSAIENDDFDLAYSNFEKVMPILSEIVKNSGYTTNNLWFADDSGIKRFINFIKRGPVKTGWKQSSIIDTWANSSEGHHSGWETFMLNYKNA